MFEIDGSKKSGSGTILRLSIALAAIRGEPLHICNIRQNRPKPGLKPQHLEAVLASAKLCDAELKGARLGSRELWFKPHSIKGGKVTAEIGTAGSIPMLLMTILPICAFAEHKVTLHASKGGTDVSHSPTISYLRFVFLPLLKRMGLEAQLIVQKYGYYPKGMGETIATVEPNKSLRSLNLESFGALKTLKGVSVCTFLEERNVAERQAKAANYCLNKMGFAAEIQVVNDKSNPLQKGSSIALWVETDTDAVLGADAIGELGKPSERVGQEVAEKLLIEIAAKPTVDFHLADMLIPYMAIARGRSMYLTRVLSEHVEANIWLAEEMLDVHFNVEKTGDLYRVERVA